MTPRLSLSGRREFKVTGKSVRDCRELMLGILNIGVSDALANVVDEVTGERWVRPSTKLMTFGKKCTDGVVDSS